MNTRRMQGIVGASMFCTDINLSIYNNINPSFSSLREHSLCHPSMKIERREREERGKCSHKSNRASAVINQITFYLSFRCF